MFIVSISIFRKKIRIEIISHYCQRNWHDCFYLLHWQFYQFSNQPQTIFQHNMIYHLKQLLHICLDCIPFTFIILYLSSQLICQWRHQRLGRQQIYKQNLNGHLESESFCEDHTARKHARDPLWLRNPGQSYQKSKNRGISGPRKRTYVLQKILKKRILTYFTGPWAWPLIIPLDLLPSVTNTIVW